MNAFGSRSTSVGHLRKYASRAKLFVCQLDLLFLYVHCTLMRLQILKLQLKISARGKHMYGNPLPILNLPFQHTKIRCESTVHPKSSICTYPQFLVSLLHILNLSFAHNHNSLHLARKSDWMPL